MARGLPLLPRRPARQLDTVHPDRRARDSETLDNRNQGWSDAARRKRPLYTQEGDLVTERTVGAEQYGRFLIDVFEAWVRHDVGRVFVQMFDVTLERISVDIACASMPRLAAMGRRSNTMAISILRPFCRADVSSSGNIHDTHMLKLVASPEQRKFGDDKRDTLTAQCQACKVRPLCNGGCPKDRFVLSREGEPGQNYLCAGLYSFFTHTQPAMQGDGRSGSAGPCPPPTMMASSAAEDARRGPISPCPCGSGQKFRFCHGNRKRRARPEAAPPSSSSSRRTAVDSNHSTRRRFRNMACKETQHPDPLGR